MVASILVLWPLVHDVRRYVGALVHDVSRCVCALIHSVRLYPRALVGVVVTGDVVVAHEHAALVAVYPWLTVVNAVVGVEICLVVKFTVRFRAALHGETP